MPSGYHVPSNLTLKNKACKYNLILRRVRVTIFVVEKQQVLFIVSVCL